MSERPFSEFREEMRYEYPELRPESVVLDCGGYEGRFAEEISRRYDCHVHVLEPVAAFHARTLARLKERPKVRVWPFGIWPLTAEQRLKIKGDMTGAYAESDEDERVWLMGVDSIMGLAPQGRFDLVKLNIEGAEFEVLDAMRRLDMLPRIRHLQVQWHDVVGGNSQAWRENIMMGLSVTHELSWDFGWVWQSWRLKD